MCGKCSKKLKPVRQPYCFRCGKPLFSGEQEYCHDCEKQKHVFDRGFSILEYDAVSSPSILAIKYKNKREFLTMYGELAKRQYQDLLGKLAPECLVPVPVSRKKYRTRGYNQAELFAREIERWSNIPVKKDLIERRKETAPLKELNPIQRRRELEKAFVWKGKDYAGERTVLIVDDIYTSGATVDACAGILKQHGIKRVYVLTMAIGMGDG